MQRYEVLPGPGHSLPPAIATMAMCAQAGHEDAMLSFRDITRDYIMRLAGKIQELKGSAPGPVAVQ